ncbi:MAG TPA: serine/threonine-protein kinase, partial [Pyrinomonadaceae bacterium]|nr:serine/threonine-protein kinase [Pyrinomonadaceae bacterium]
MQSALQPGDSLGRYEIRSKLGEGGMGVVYLAFDPNIGRNVAIKVLPSSFSADEERLERFRQEAQAVGALNHSNILSIYDIDAENGTPYVVFELLEGETLRELLHETMIAPRKAVDYALQIVRGLAAVHDKGIIHRDLKPENIFVTTNGRVKILDFGLAKLADAFFQSEAQTNVQTRKFNTEPGMIVGTLGYMSPEQLRGDAVDHRTDIFSFGAIVYEMLSGKFAFQRDSQAETIGAILKEDPPEVPLPNSNVAPALERIARHCLEKNRADRFQSTHDLAFDLESLAQSPPRGTTTEAVNAPQSKRRLWPLVVVGLALIAAASLAAFLAGKRTGASVPPKFRQLTFRLGSIYSARFANDGQMVVYGAAWDGGRTQLYSTRPESPESRSLGLPGGDIFAISAEGEMAISLGSPVSFGGTLAQAPLAGGAP